LRLLQERADVNAAAAARYNGSKTALQAAAGGGHLAVVERLLQERADVNAAAAHSGGRTALQAAAEGGHLAVVERYETVSGHLWMMAAGVDDVIGRRWDMESKLDAGK
jgi:ankyrin repeat protein